MWARAIPAMSTQEIDARGMMIIPGFVNIHSHPGHEPGWKGMLEELGSPRLGQSSLYEFMPVFQIGPQYTPPGLAGRRHRNC